MTSALFQSLFDLEIAIEIKKVHKRFITLPITDNTIILARRAIKFLNLRHFIQFPAKFYPVSPSNPIFKKIFDITHNSLHHGGGGKYTIPPPLLNQPKFN